MGFRAGLSFLRLEQDLKRRSREQHSDREEYPCTHLQERRAAELAAAPNVGSPVADFNFFFPCSLGSSGRLHTPDTLPSKQGVVSVWWLLHNDAPQLRFPFSLNSPSLWLCWRCSNASLTGEAGTHPSPADRDPTPKSWGPCRPFSRHVATALHPPVGSGGKRMAEPPFKTNAEPIITGSAREGSGVPRWEVREGGVQQPTCREARETNGFKI